MDALQLSRHVQLAADQARLVREAPPIVATDHLAVYEAGPDLQVIDRLDNQREPPGPVVTPSVQQPYADGILSAIIRSRHA